MKQLTHSVTRCNRRAIAPTLSVICIIFMLALVSPGCQKEITEDEPQLLSHSKGSDALTRYVGLSKETMWELQQAKAGSAKYKDIANAIADGYMDINVVVPGMGAHYLKPSLVDGTFDIRHPEILVYNRNEEGKMILVAVEYAVTKDASPSMPSGFSGNGDVWDDATVPTWWLLHAWVWKYNPDGVFNPFNPDAHHHVE